MNEIRQLCTASLSPSQHLDEILALFHACPPQYLLPSLSLIGQAISCMPIEELNIDVVNHPLFLVIRQWSERLLQLWLVNSTLNDDEHRALFYTHQLFKLLSEWLNQQEDLLIASDHQEIVQHVLTNLFVEQDFLHILCRVICQLITNENDEQHSFIASHLSNDEDHVSPDDIQLHTPTSDHQVEQADVLDVLFRCVNSLVILFSHPILLSNPITNKNLTPCLVDYLHSPLFIQLSTKFLRQNLTNEKIHIRSIFLLFTCLDYGTLSVTTSTFNLLPSIRQILHVWCEIPQDSSNDLSPLIVRFIRLINRLILLDKDSIIQENLCAFLVPHFETLCLTSIVIDDMASILITLARTKAGKRHLRRLGYIHHILQAIKRHSQLWQPLALLITPRDLYQSSLFKKLIHLLTQRTIKIFQALTTATNDTSFDSTTISSKDQIYIIATEWFILLRTNFLSFTMIVDELINYTKKVNLIHMIIDAIRSLIQDDDSLTTLIDIMIDLLWTFLFSTSTNIHDILQKRLDLCQWLKTNLNTSTSSICFASHAILSLLDSNNKSLSNIIHLFLESTYHSLCLDRTISHHPSALTTNNIICLFYSDEFYEELCMVLRDRLEIEFDYSVELILSSTCESFDSLLHLINQSSLCLFCASTRMKIDNLVHFVYQYLSCQPYSIPTLTIPMEDECELEGSWLEPMMMVDMQSVFYELRHHLNQMDGNDISLSKQRSNALSVSQTCDVHSNQTQDSSCNYMTCPVHTWSLEDVSEWCKATQGSFETLEPLVMRLNGSALAHLAEMLSIEPASMYHSLNDELVQRTGTNVPLTEYVSLRSELQSLLNQKQNQCTATTSENSEEDSYRTKQKKSSRLCVIL